LLINFFWLTKFTIQHKHVGAYVVYWLQFSFIIQWRQPKQTATAINN